MKVGKHVKNGSVNGVTGGGTNHFTSGANAETVQDHGGTDTIKLGGGNDTPFGNNPAAHGNGAINGGKGVDTYGASAATHTVNINFDIGRPVYCLTLKTALGTDVGGDTVTGFENAIGGSANDTRSSAQMRPTLSQVTRAATALWSRWTRRSDRRRRRRHLPLLEADRQRRHRIRPRPDHRFLMSDGDQIDLSAQTQMEARPATRLRLRWFRQFQPHSKVSCANLFSSGSTIVSRRRQRRRQGGFLDRAQRPHRAGCRRLPTCRRFSARPGPAPNWNGRREPAGGQVAPHHPDRDQDRQAQGQ